MRYATAVKTNLYNFKNSLKNKRVSFKDFFHFKDLHIASLSVSQSERGRALAILVSLFSPRVPEISIDLPSRRKEKA